MGRIRIRIIIRIYTKSLTLGETRDWDRKRQNRRWLPTPRFHPGWKEGKEEREKIKKNKKKKGKRPDGGGKDNPHTPPLPPHPLHPKLLSHARLNHTRALPLTPTPSLSLFPFLVGGGRVPGLVFRAWLDRRVATPPSVVELPSAHLCLALPSLAIVVDGEE